MMRLIACENCGKITSGRSDKRTCSNACAVKLNYAKQHSFSTPYERYIESIKEGQSEKPEILIQNIPIANGKIHNTSEIALQEAQKRLIEINEKNK